MAPWPFRFKGSSATPSTSSNKPSSSYSAVLGPDQLPPRKSIEAMMKRATSKRGQAAVQPVDQPPPPRPTRTYTYSLVSDRHDPVHAGREKRRETPNLRIHPVSWDLAPTLHHKRSNGDVVARKSSFRRKPEQSRDADIKAYFSPVRAATHSWAPGSPPSHHVPQRAKTTMETEPMLKPPVPDLSLLPRGSVHSALSLEPEPKSYKVSALEALSPRPTLKCVEAPALSKRASFPARAGSKKGTFGDCEPIPEEMLKAHKRIDDLADGFNASELRELMERDARRRERNQRQDRDKAAQRLARRAEKQKLIEAEARKSGTPIPENLDRGVMGRELVGVAVDPPSAVVTSSRQRRLSEPSLGTNKEEGLHEKSRDSKRPLQFFHREDEIPVELVDSSSANELLKERAAEDVEQVAELPSSSKPEGGTGSKKSMSKSTLGSDKEKAGSAFDDEAITRKDSVASSKASRLSLIALLKWGMRGRRDLSSPSSFSNTSREEMQAAAAQMRAQGGDADSATSALTGNFISKSGQGTSKLMRSRFREDLPEFPPNSRIQSVDLSAGELSSLNDMRESPTNLHQSTEGLSPGSPSVENTSPFQAAEPHMSMSFASVDSEASWLANRIGSQRSTSRETAAQAKGSDRIQSSKSWDSSLQQDDSLVAEDEEVRESDIKVVGFSTQPQPVHIHKPNRDTIHSHEVLLDMDSENEEDIKSQLSGDSGERADLQHARRVSVSHIHNYSAGSAKIFQIASSSGSLRGKKQG